MAVIMKEKGCTSSTIGYYLVVIGAINWGLVGLGDLFGANWNLVYLVFGRMMWAEALVYLAIGVAGVVTLVGCRCHTCASCRADMVKQKDA